MKKLNRLFFVIITLLLNVNLVFAQEEGGPPTSYDANAKPFKKVKNILKTDITSIIGGEFLVSWEHKFTKKVGMNLGAGVLLPYYLEMDMSKWWNNRLFPDDFPRFHNDKVGFSAAFSFNIYALEDVWGAVFFNPLVHYRRYSTVEVWNFGFEGGYSRLFFNVLSFDAGVCAYGLIQKSLDETTYFFDPTKKINGFGGGLFIRLGYVIN
jgi:hypothetical protein